MELFSLSLHYNSPVRQTDSYDAQQMTSLLMSSYDCLALPASPTSQYGLSRVFPLAIRTMTG
jgi:hypothetical protein